MDRSAGAVIGIAAVIFGCWVACTPVGDMAGRIRTPEKPKIIFDTDMGPDYDDVGAITVLHALADSGECELLATVASDRHPSVAPTIALFNRYFGRDTLPVGIAVPDAPELMASNGWNDSLINRYAPELRNRDFPDAVRLYRQVLAGQPDTSVTVVTVGFLSNLAALLTSGPDQYSALTGEKLVQKKVKKLVAMAGAFPEGSEFNVNQHPEASSIVFSQWPRPILFSGFEVGVRIMTGKQVGSRTGDDPVTYAYRYNLETYDGKPAEHRNSWDQTAVLAAIRDPEESFYVNGPGRFIVRPDGSNTWDPAGNTEHYFLVHKFPYVQLADRIEGLMLHVPEAR